MGERNNIKILVASTIYGFQDQLATIYTQLDSYGYDVLNSHMGTVFADPEKSNLQDCLAAVDECDVFLGIIRPHYGSGVIGEKSIFHEEVNKAIELKKPRWFLADSRVVFARQIFRKSTIVERNTAKEIKVENILVRSNDVFDIRSVEIYNEVTQDKIPAKERIGHWVQEYYDLPGITRFVEGQFMTSAKVSEIIKRMKVS
jgi:hypothetical protein